MNARVAATSRNTCSLVPGCSFDRHHLGSPRRGGCAVAPGPQHQQNTGDDRAQAGDLGIAHAPIDAGIDADEFHQEARHTTEHQVFASDLAQTGRRAPDFAPRRHR